MKHLDAMGQNGKGKGNAVLSHLLLLSRLVSGRLLDPLSPHPPKLLLDVEEQSRPTAEGESLEWAFGLGFSGLGGGFATAELWLWQSAVFAAKGARWRCAEKARDRLTSHGLIYLYFMLSCFNAHRDLQVIPAEQKR